MATLITALSLGSLYSLITINFLFNYSVFRYLNFALLGYIMIVPYLMSELAKNQASIIIYLLSLIAVYALLFVISYFVSTFLLENLKNVSSELKIIGSVSIFSIIFTLVSLIWPNDVLYETPLDGKTFTIFGSEIAMIDIFSILVTVIVLFSIVYFFRKTQNGIVIRAYSVDSEIAKAYGASTKKIRIFVHLATAFLCLISGTLLSAPGAPRAGVKSLIFFSLVAIAAVICARHVNYIIGVVAAFIIAITQVFILRYLKEVNDFANKILSIGPLDGKIDLGSNFADRFLPYFIALVCLAIIPNRFFKKVSK